MKNQGQASSRQALAGKMTLLSALLAGAFAVSAQAATAEAWVATSTKAHDPRAAVHVAPLKAGEQVIDNPGTLVDGQPVEVSK